jgi:antitoxin HigA-1
VIVQAGAFLNELTGGSPTLAETFSAVRQSEGWSQIEMGRRLGIGLAHVCDIETSRRWMSPDRAARFARTLGYSETQFVRLALQDLLKQLHLRMTVSVDAA